MKMDDQIWALSLLDLKDSVAIKPSSQKVPSWSGVNAIWSKEQIPLSQVSFLPQLPFPVTVLNIVYRIEKSSKVCCHLWNNQTYRSHVMKGFTE